MSRLAPRRAGDAVGTLLARVAPRTTLARAQEAWPRAAGAAVAAACVPSAERDGVLVVRCESAAWAHELDLLAADVVERLNAELGGEHIRALRCRST